MVIDCELWVELYSGVMMCGICVELTGDIYRWEKKSESLTLFLV